MLVPRLSNESAHETCQAAGCWTILKSGACRVLTWRDLFEVAL